MYELVAVPRSWRRDSSISITTVNYTNLLLMVKNGKAYLKQ